MCNCASECEREKVQVLSIYPKWANPRHVGLDVFGIWWNSRKMAHQLPNIPISVQKYFLLQLPSFLFTMAPVLPKTNDSNADYLTAAFFFFKELCHHLQQRASFQQQGEMFVDAYLSDKHFSKSCCVPVWNENRSISENLSKNLILSFL